MTRVARNEFTDCSSDICQINGIKKAAYFMQAAFLLPSNQLSFS